MLEGKTFLVTGATGRLGSETVMRLEELGATVLPLVMPGYPLEPKRVVWRARCKPIPVCERNDLHSLMDPDYVINLHWRVNRSLSFTDQMLFEIESNIHLPAHVWEWLAGRPVACVVNISSIHVFSSLNDNPISSETQPRPATPYGIAKLSAEHFFDACFAGSGRPVVHLRLCSVASPGEHPSHLMSSLYANAYENRPITLNEGHTCHLIYIDEVVDLIIQAALSAEPNTYIITTEPVPIHRVASVFEEISGRNLSAEYRDLHPGIADRIFISDTELFRTPWTRSTPLSSMIRHYIEARSNTSKKLHDRTLPHQN